MTGMFAIIRTQKHKTISAVARSARHTFREQPTLNADSSQSSRNKFSGSRSTKALLSSLSDRLPVTRRKDAVLCIEYLITASPEAFSKHGGHLDDLGSGYFASALTWLRARHGQDNIVCAAVHLDETTPHLVVYVVPLTCDGRLSAREFLGGPKLMRDMQDSFYSACGLPYGLQRGIQGSKAHHTQVAQFYSAIQNPLPDEPLSALDYAAKALGHETDAWRQAQAQVRQIAQQATANALQRKALHSRELALTRAEEQVRLSTLHLKQNAQEQAQREQSLRRREQTLARREPELEIAQARVEAAERLLALKSEREDAIQRPTLQPPTPCPNLR